jgi:hypothetical protein
MTQDVIKDLQKDAPSAFHEQMLQESLALVKRSRSKMSDAYGDWDRQDEVYRGERMPDKEDQRQAEKDKPVKMVVPHTYAQVNTFTATLFLLFKQNPRFFALRPTGSEDYGRKNEDSELVLEQNLEYNGLNRILFQHLLDCARFGPAPLEVGWTRDVRHIQVENTVVTPVDGVSVTSLGGSRWEEVVKYEGNLVRNVSPYRWFPDTNYPMVEFQKGEFCAAEEEYSMSRLRSLETAGEVAGVDKIPPFHAETLRARGMSRLSYTVNDTYRAGFGANNSGCPVTVTKLQRWIVPSKYEIDGKEKLGPEEFPVLYHVWYANDSRLIRCEPCSWWHNEFGWTLSQFTPDMHRTITLGLADLIYRLQEVISWFINSHITSVRRVMNNRLIVNPSTVETKSLDGEGDIYIRKGVGMAIPPERLVGQLRVQDVTAGHMGDVELISRIMQVVTGVNDMAQGQFNTGRRSATEARNVAGGAAGRMKMHAHLVWETGLGRLGRLMLSNVRQALSYDSFAAIVGEAEDTQQRHAAFRGTPQEVARGADYFMFDSTFAAEHGYVAQSLQELLISAMSNPQVMQMWDLDPRALMEEIQRLRGLGPMNRFSLSKRVEAGKAAALPPVVMPNPGVAGA